MADLKTLRPDLVPWAKYLYSIGKFYDGRLVVTSALRSAAKQERLYKAFRRGESDIPAAPPGGSLHQYGLAFDMARIGMDPHSDALLTWLGRVWESWGGRYGGTNDPVHFDVRL